VSTYSGGDGSSRASPEVAQRLAEGSASGDRYRAVRAYWEANVSVGFAEDANAYAAYRANALKRRVAVPVIAAQLQAIAAHDTLRRLHDPLVGLAICVPARPTRYLSLC
jgi:3-oxoadipate enol-lactonase